MRLANVLKNLEPLNMTGAAILFLSLLLGGYVATSNWYFALAGNLVAIFFVGTGLVTWAKPLNIRGLSAPISELSGLLMVFTFGSTFALKFDRFYYIGSLTGIAFGALLVGIRKMSDTKEGLIEDNGRSIAQV